MNRVKITLASKEYAIQTEESASYVKQLAASLDSKIESVLEDNNGISIADACMLVSLSLTDDCFKAASDKDNLRRQVIGYLEEVAKSQTQVSELNKEIESLKSQNEIMALKLLAYGEKGEKNERKHF